MNLAIVVQRYGEGVVGGSEEHCRAITERLAANHQVTVLTSQARDYVSWKPEFRAGTQRNGSMTVVRFPNRKRRRARWFDINEMMLSEDLLPEEEDQWFRENGPRSPKLLHYLERHGNEFDAVLFWTYRYFPSYFGLPLVADRAVLVPTAEEDPAIRIGQLGNLFSLPRGFLFLTPEERDLVSSRVSGALAPSAVIGSGLEPASSGDGTSTLTDLGIDKPFALYLGRVDLNKGCATMFWNYLRYVSQSDSPIPLVVAGRAVMEIPQSPHIHALGYVSDSQRELLLSQADVVLMPSPYESLCIALLEAWNHGRPALVNGRCKVLRGQVIRANGGLYYDNPEEFGEAVRFLVEQPEIAAQLGRQGLRYVDQNYRWPIVMGKIEDFLHSIVNQSAETSRE